MWKSPNIKIRSPYTASYTPYSIYLRGTISQLRALTLNPKPVSPKHPEMFCLTQEIRTDIAGCLAGDWSKLEEEGLGFTGSKGWDKGLSLSSLGLRVLEL